MAIPDKLYKPIAATMFILSFGLTIFVLYQFVDSFYPLRYCAGYWVFFIFGPLIIFYGIPVSVYMFIGIRYAKKKPHPEIYDMNRVKTKADQKKKLEYAGLAFGLIGLLFLSVFCAATTFLVVGWNVAVTPNVYASYTSTHINGTYARINRDGDNILRLVVLTPNDGAYTQGFAMASERYYQMDLSRRIATGHLAELLGPSAISSDTYFRTLGLEYYATETFNNLQHETQVALQQFTYGVNSWENQIQSIPLELKVYGYGFVPWKVTDSIAILKLYQWMESGNFNHELERLRLLLDRALNVSDTLKVDPPYPLTYGNGTFSSFQATDFDESVANLQVNIAAENISLALDQVNAANLQAFCGVTPTTNYNQTVDTNSLGDLHNYWDPIYGTVGVGNKQVGTSMSATTFATSTIAGFPLLGSIYKGKILAPTEWILMQLQTTDISMPISTADGACIPGVPGIWNGRNAAAAWQVNTMGADITDLYLMNETSSSTYFYNGQILSYSIRYENISVLGQTQPITIKIRESVYGPVISDAISNSPGNGRSLSLKWAGWRNDTTLDWLWQAWQTVQWTDFSALTVQYFQAPASSITFSTPTNNPGFIQAGLIPLRGQGHSGMFPMIGNGTFDWVRFYTPFSTRRWPVVTIIVVGGARLVNRGYHQYLGYDWEDEWTPQYFYNSIAAFPNSGRNIDGTDMQQLLGDTTDAFFLAFLPVLQLLNSSSTNPNVIPLVSQLSNWNGVCDSSATGSSNCALWTAWYWELTTLGQAAGTGVLYWDKPRFILNALLNNDASCGTNGCVAFAESALLNASFKASEISPQGTFLHILLNSTAWGCACDRWANFYGSPHSINSLSRNDPNKGYAINQAPTYKQVIDYNVPSGQTSWLMPMGNSGMQYEKYNPYDQYLPIYQANEFMTSMSLAYSAVKVSVINQVIPASTTPINGSSITAAVAASSLN